MRNARHLLAPDWVVRRAFSPAVLRRIGEAISASERRHRGEIRFAVEAGLPLPLVPPRRRAEQLFAQLGVWDTEDNSGVLVYVQYVDRDIEIVADRGIAARVPNAEWEAICQRMERAFRERRFEQGSLEAIDAVTQLLERHFPPRGTNPNELPDQPTVL
ncbi:MAG TPA: TPM domain-containing protein [Burkholderiales bacterium]|nr:TPM domain-containing protein [Burkholderiales bacterium]